METTTQPHNPVKETTTASEVAKRGKRAEKYLNAAGDIHPKIKSELERQKDTYHKMLTNTH